MKFQKSDVQTRAVFTVTPHLAGWAVEYEGDVYDPCRTMEEARAAATRRARACQDTGRPCQINVKGERGFFAARVRPVAEVQPDAEIDADDEDEIEAEADAPRVAMPA